ncbi:hypothetical protein BU15DRAFT_69584, partial [Melanogaster broomeanus]
MSHPTADASLDCSPAAKPSNGVTGEVGALRVSRFCPHVPLIADVNRGGITSTTGPELSPCKLKETIVPLWLQHEARDTRILSMNSGMRSSGKRKKMSDTLVATIAGVGPQSGMDRTLMMYRLGVRKVSYHRITNLASCHKQTSTQQMLYYGYAVSEQWLLEEAAKRNIQCERREVTVLNVAMQIMYDTDLWSDELSSFKKVRAKPACGGPEREYWCFALATNDRRDRLPQFRGKGIAP